MSKTEIATALGACFTALGIPAERSAYCTPILSGEVPVPNAGSFVPPVGRLITITEGARLAGLSRTTLWRLTREGGLRTVSVRGKNRIRIDDLAKITNGGSC